ncbi:hypothetical protein BC826DRAFT_1179539 [Russula brevipes]|nr:hypothetical protein BC826DRAFT_1179539 [Russula brevipes]
MDDVGVQLSWQPRTELGSQISAFPFINRSGIGKDIGGTSTGYCPCPRYHPKGTRSGGGEEMLMSFKHVATEAFHPVALLQAGGFFFKLIVLGTRNRVQLSRAWPCLPKNEPLEPSRRSHLRLLSTIYDRERDRTAGR